VDLRRVLIGTDFSEASMAAARWTARHLAPDAELVLMHAVDVPKPPVFLLGVLPAAEDVTKNAGARAEQRLRDLATELEPANVRTELRVGDTAGMLVSMVRKLAPDLVVIGGHGARRGVLGLIGSTTEQLVRVSPAPVLVARGLEDLPPRSILAPLDPSPATSRVLDWSRTLQQRFGARVTACYAVDVLQAYGRIRTVSAASRIAEMEKDLRAQSVAWIRERLREAGFADEDADVQVTVGDPRAAIPLLAERVDADLVVMGSRGAGAVGRAVLGSVAGAVLNTTTFPVLVVPGRSPRSRQG
jgi:nucleotide-binding universal stress UspA family protein